MDLILRNTRAFADHVTMGTQGHLCDTTDLPIVSSDNDKWIPFFYKSEEKDDGAGQPTST
jgi:hypothetical protein